MFVTIIANNDVQFGFAVKDTCGFKDTKETSQ